MLPEFNILEYLSALEIFKELPGEYHCRCPVCGDGGLKINKRTRKFNAFKCGCSIASIREAIRPLEQALAENSWQKPVRPRQTRQWQYCDLDGKPKLTVKRIDDGKGGRKISRHPAGVDVATLAPYRWPQAQVALDRGELVFIVEGEPCADALAQRDLNAISFCGGSNSPHYRAYVDLLKPYAGQLVICPDRDQAGVQYAEAITEAVGITQWLYAFPDSSQWQRTLPKKDGADIADWLADGATVEEILLAMGQKRQVGQRRKQQSSNIIDHPTWTDYSAVRQALDRLILEGVTGAALRQELAQIAENHRCNPRQVDQLYWELFQEYTCKTDVASAADGLGEIASIRSAGLPIELGLHGDGGQLASQFRQVAEAMPTAPEFLMTTLIPAAASRIGTSSRLVISATAGYTVAPIFRTIVVAKTGRKKTPSQAVVMDALARLEEIYYQTYELDKAEYEAELERWESLSRQDKADEPRPQKPIRKRYFSNDDTLAARIQIHAENPRGFLLYRDEASAFITERGRFASGKGDNGETEADLSEFNGKSLSRDRKTDGSIFMARTAISRTGATQYSKLQALMGKHQDDCGEWARYLFCAADSPPSYLDLTKDVGDLGLQKSLIQLLERLDELPEQDYLLSDSAKMAFMRYQHQLTDRAIATDHPSLQSAFPKFETYFGRFCLWLHIVNAVLAGQQPELTVSAETVAIAQQWTEYYIGQFKLILALNSPQQSLTGDLLKLHAYLERKGEGKTPRQIVQAGVFASAKDSSKRKTPYIQELLKTLVQKGWATVEDNSYTAIHPATEPGSQGETVASDSPPPIQLPTTPAEPDNMVKRLDDEVRSLMASPQVTREDFIQFCDRYPQEIRQRWWDTTADQNLKLQIEQLHNRVRAPVAG